MAKQNIKKLFIIRKYIWAKNAPEAIRKEKRTPPDDVWIDEEWKKNSILQPKDAIGFYSPKDNDY